MATELATRAQAKALETQRLNLRTYNVRDYGAVGDGTTDDTTAIRSAFADMGAQPGGRLYVPPGQYRTSAQLDLNLGYPNASLDGNAQNTAGTAFMLDMVGSVKPDSGVDRALWVHGGYRPLILARFEGGGRAGLQQDDPAVGTKMSTGLYLSDLCGPIVEVYGKKYLGVLLASKATASDSTDKVVNATVRHLYGHQCGQLFDLNNMVGFGQVMDAWDNAPAWGSQLVNCMDVTLAQFENLFTQAGRRNLAIRGGDSIHIGTIAIGFIGSDMLYIADAANVTIQEAFILAHGGGNPAGTGLTAVNTNVHITHLRTYGAQVGLRPYDASVTVSQHDDYQSWSALSLGGTTPRVTVTAAQYVRNPNNGVNVDGTLTGGWLRLGGVIRSTNPDNTNTSNKAAVSINAPANSAFALYATDLIQEQSNVSIGVYANNPAQINIVGGTLANGASGIAAKLLKLGPGGYLWNDATGKTRTSLTYPASDTAGTVVGTQT